MREKCECGSVLPVHLFGMKLDNYSHVCLCEREWAWNADKTEIVRVGADVNQSVHDDVVPKCWVVIYSHPFGVDAWPMFSDDEPTEDEIKKLILDDSGPFDEKNDVVEVRGPWKVPCEELASDQAEEAR